MNSLPSSVCVWRYSEWKQRQWSSFSLLVFIFSHASLFTHGRKLGNLTGITAFGICACQAVNCLQALFQGDWGDALAALCALLGNCFGLLKDVCHLLCRVIRVRHEVWAGVTQGCSLWCGHGRGPPPAGSAPPQLCQVADPQACHELSRSWPGLPVPQPPLQAHLAAPHGRGTGQDLHPSLGACRNIWGIGPVSAWSPGRPKAYVLLISWSCLHVINIWVHLSRLGWAWKCPGTRVARFSKYKYWMPS